MPSIRWLRLLGAATLLVLPLVSCGDSGDPTDTGGSSERSVTLTLSTGTVVPGQVVTVTAAEPLFDAPTYTATAGGGLSVEVVRVDSATALFALPLTTPAGSYTLELVDAGDWRSTLNVQVGAAPAVTDADAVVAEVLADVDAMLAEAQSLATDSAIPADGGVQLAAAVAAELAAWRDTASVESQARVAALLQANPELLAPVGAPAGVSSSLMLDPCPASSTSPAAAFTLCQGRTTVSVAQAAVTMVVAGVLCHVEPSSCLVSGALAVTAIVRAKGYVVRMGEMPGIAFGQIVARFVPEDDGTWPVGLSAAAVSGMRADTLSFVAGRPYTLGADAEFRSIVSSDRSLHPIVAAVFDAIESVREVWQTAVDVVAIINDFVFGTLPAVPAAPSMPPGTPANSTMAELPADSVSIDAVSGPVTVDYDVATRTFTVTTQQGGDVPFSFDLVYHYVFGEVRTRYDAVVGASAVIDVTSGDGQTGKPGETLTDALVVRVTSLVDGSPIEGATVTWTVTGGNGTVAGGTTTDLNGEAIAAWTLGPAEGAQSVEATATLADGSAVSGSAAFTASAELQLQLVQVWGDDQTGEPHTALAEPLIVRLVDQDLMPVAGRTISWGVTSGDGTISATSTVTDANGEGQVTWTLGADSSGTVDAWMFVDGLDITGSPVVFSASIPSGGPPSYTMTVIPSIGVGASLPQALSNTGRAVGHEFDPGSGRNEAWMWDGSNVTPIVVGNRTDGWTVSDAGAVGIYYSAATTNAIAIWENGNVQTLDVAGDYDVTVLRGGTYGGDLFGAAYDRVASRYVAVRWSSAGAATLLPNPGDDPSATYGGTDTGVSVGATQPLISGTTRGREAAIWNGTAYSRLDDGNGAGQSSANDANDGGIVAGWAHDGGGCQVPARWVNGVIQLLPRLDAGCFYRVEAVNAAGQIVGGSNNGLAALWLDDQVYDLNGLVVDLNGAHIELAMDINDAGIILATAVIDGVDRAVLLTPQ